MQKLYRDAQVSTTVASRPCCATCDMIVYSSVGHWCTRATESSLSAHCIDTPTLGPDEAGITDTPVVATTAAATSWTKIDPASLC